MNRRHHTSKRLMLSLFCVFFCPLLLSYQSCQLPEQHPTIPHEGRTPCIDRLCPSMGELTKIPSSSYYRNQSPQVRAYLQEDSSKPQYHLPFSLLFKEISEVKEKVAFISGIKRKQIGLKLYAKDSCNVLYVMWRDPLPGHVVISYKYNAQDHEHRECGNQGYTTLQDIPVPALIKHEDHALLSVQMDGKMLSVFVQNHFLTKVNIPSFVIDEQAPRGLRIDNGIFEFSPSVSTSPLVEGHLSLP